MTFFSRLEHRIRQINSFLCIGLDPHPQDLPVQSGAAARDFCLRLVDKTSDLAAAYKPNAAFFEGLGVDGIQTLAEVISEIPDEIPVILDAKRGDIASTARAYAQAVFDVLGADAVTLSPYLGFDSIEPFIEKQEHGVFLLCKTSNSGAQDMQDQLVAEGIGEPAFTPLYIHVAQLAKSWNLSDNLGLVVGATQPDSLAKVREAAPDLWILTPGVGMQGGDLKLALQAGLRTDGMGILVPISRGISRADNVRRAALEYRDVINRERDEIKKLIRSPRQSALAKDLARIADGLLEAGCIKFGDFTLKSGAKSPIYIDLRRLVGYPRLLSEIANAYIQVLRGLEFDHLAALPYAALPIASAISLKSNCSMVYPRKETKTYGTKAQIEGVFSSKEVVVVIDDLISTGGSKIEGIEKLTSVGLVVHDIVVLIDRSLEGNAELTNRSIRLHSLMTLPEILDYYQMKDAVPDQIIKTTRKILFNRES
jgi:uridine monophosphate synthetase